MIEMSFLCALSSFLGGIPLTFAFTPDKIMGLLSSCSNKADIPDD